MINIVSETLKLVIFNGKCNILLQLSVKIHPNLYYWIKIQRKPFTANLIMVPSWHFGVSSLEVSSGRNGRKWKKNPFLPVSSECPEETYFFQKKPNPATPMWGLISLPVLIEHLPQLTWMPTCGTAIRDFRHQTAVYLESLLWHESNSTAPCHAVSLQRQCVNASHAQPDYWS